MKSKTKTGGKTAQPTKEELAARIAALAQFKAGCKTVASATATLTALAVVALKAGCLRKELLAIGEESGLHARTVANVVTMAAREAGIARQRKPSTAYSIQAVRLALYAASVYGSETTAKKLLLSARRFLGLKVNARKAAARDAKMLPKVLLPKEHGEVKVLPRGKSIGAAKLTKNGVLRNAA